MKDIISIITVNWNCAQLIHNSIDTLHEHTNLDNIEFIWIDNNSHPDDYNYLKNLKQQYHDFNITLIRNNENQGFSKACNLGAQYANGKYIAFINPDTCFTQDTLSKLIKKLKQGSKIGLIAPKIIDGNGMPVRSAGKTNTILRIAFGEIFLHLCKKLGKASCGGYYTSFEQTLEPDWVLGSFMLLPRKVFDAVGGFDERYFMYAEEADLCLSIRQKGYKILYYPKTEVVHIGEGAAEKVPELTAKRKMDSEFKFFSKWRNVWYARANALINSLTAAAKSAVYVPSGVFGNEKAALVSDKYWKTARFRLVEFFKSFLLKLNEN